jgi:hypothetical protein
MFKYVRMAKAVAGSGSLDIEKADENPDPTFGSFLSQLPRLAAASRRIEGSLVAIADAASHGRIYTGR